MLLLVPASRAAFAQADAESALPGRLESFYSDRAGESLRQYGYRLFETLPPPGDRPAGAVQDEYLVGTGDRLAVTFRGNRALDVVAEVDRSGRLILPEMPPIPAAGRTLAELRAHLRSAVAARLAGTEVWLGLESVRQIDVLVTGEVPRPGRHRLSAFAGVLDALAVAGGVDRRGSLRAIRLVRDGTVRPVDLYELLQGDSAAAATAAAMPVRDGDRLIVPPLGATIAVLGSVRRPGIYELPPGATEIDAAAAVRLAGGPLQPGPVTLLHRVIGPDGIDRTAEVAPSGPAKLADGDMLRVAPRLAGPSGEVRLTGHVAAPGAYALSEAPTLAGLIGGPERLGDRPYLPFAALERRDPSSGARVLHPVGLTALLAGRTDRPLADGDRLIVLSSADMAFLASAPVLALLRGERLRADDLARCSGLAALARALGPDGDDRLRDGRLAEAARRLAPVPAACPDAFDRFPDLLPLAVANSVVIWQGVPRPGLYPAASATGLGDLLALAGGGSAADARVLERPGAQSARPGETLAARPPQVALTGPVALPGWRELAAAPSLARLLGDGEILEPGVYPLFGAVVRREPGGLAERVLPFSPGDVVAGAADMPLADGDRVRLFSNAEIQRLFAGRHDGGSEAPAASASAGVGAVSARPGGGRPDGPDDARLAGLLAEHSVSLTGAVARPGSYPVAEATTLAQLLAAAGGVTRQADRTALEITRQNAVAGPSGERVPATARFAVDLTWQNPDTVAVRPGDAVQVPPRYDPVIPAAVTIGGEVLRPGTYPLVRGDRLSDLIARAGGLTPAAYPDGAVFTRAAERERRRAEFRSLADSLERRLAARLLEDDPPADGEVALTRELIADLRTVDPPGRIVVEADPDLLALHPDRDPLLQPGDSVHFPARSLTVRVSGEVLAPAALPFRSGMSADDYIRAAGGYTRHADRDRIHVVYPDGSAEPVAQSLWRFRSVRVPPGSVIVVPLDPEPFDFLAFTESVAGVLSRIALTAASISVIGD